MVGTKITEPGWGDACTVTTDDFSVTVTAGEEPDPEAAFPDLKMREKNEGPPIKKTLTRSMNRITPITKTMITGTRSDKRESIDQ